MAYAEAAGAAREAPVGNERTLSAQVHALDIRRWIEHFLHARAALGPFVGDDHAVAALHPPTEYSLAGIFL